VGVFLPEPAAKSGVRYATAPARTLRLAPGAALDCELPCGADAAPETLGQSPAHATGTVQDEEEEEALLERLTARDAEPTRPPPVLRFRQVLRGADTGLPDTLNPRPGPRTPQAAASGGGNGGGGGGGGGAGQGFVSGFEDAGAAWSDPVALQPGSSEGVGGARLRVRVTQRCASTHVAILPQLPQPPRHVHGSSGGRGASLEGPGMPSGDGTHQGCCAAANGSARSGAAAASVGRAPLEVQLAVDSLQARSTGRMSRHACLVPRWGAALTRLDRAGS